MSPAIYARNPGSTSIHGSVAFICLPSTFQTAHTTRASYRAAYCRPDTDTDTDTDTGQPANASARLRLRFPAHPRPHPRLWLHAREPPPAATTSRGRPAAGHVSVLSVVKRPPRKEGWQQGAERATVDRWIRSAGAGYLGAWMCIDHVVTTQDTTYGFCCWMDPSTDRDFLPSSKVEWWRRSMDPLKGRWHAWAEIYMMEYVGELSRLTPWLSSIYMTLWWSILHLGCRIALIYILLSITVWCNIYIYTYIMLHTCV